MEKNKLFDNFTKQYSISKTLRFELISQRETEKHIKEKKLLEEDKERADDYKKVKKLIDEYHKDFIEQALSDKKLKELRAHYDEFNELMGKPAKERDTRRLNSISEKLRKEVAKLLEDNPTKDEKKLIEEKVPDFLRRKGRNGDAELVLKFKGFTTYFGGFNDNRKNIYSEKDQSTAISYRIVHENLPKFIINIKNFQHLIQNYKIDFSEIETQMKDELGVKKLKNIFSIDYFNNCLTQTGIDRYNAILGGKTNKTGKKIQGINEKINLFRQKNKLTGKQSPILAPLYKLILSDRTTLSFFPEKFKTSEELITNLYEFYEETINGFVKGNEKKNIIEEMNELLSKRLTPSDCDLTQVYIKKSFINTISQQIFGSYSVTSDALNFFINKTYKTKAEKERQQKKSYLSIAEIETALKEYLLENEIENEEKKKEILMQDNPILAYFKSFSVNTEINNKKAKINLLAYFKQQHAVVKDVLKNKYEDKNGIIQDKRTIAAIKDYLDSYMHILHFIKPLFIDPIDKKEAEMPVKDAFYSEFDELFHELKSVVSLYNKTRDFVTQKPYSTERIKLNFENVSLLSGWDVNKETDNTSVIFRKDGLYYLGIMDKEHNSIFQNIPPASSGKNDFYEKMYYKLLPGANKMLPKVIFSEKWIKHFNPSDKLLRKYEKGTHTKGDNFSLNDCHALIDFFKASIAKHEDWRQFDFRFSSTETYQDISGFYREVEHQGYKISFGKVSSDYIHQLVSEGKLFLFKIYSKDFSPYSKGRPNLHTLYWKMLFDEDNLKDVVLKLNGEAEVFYRPASIPEKSKTIHQKNVLIDNKNPNNPKKQSLFEKYDIVKDKRYTENKYHFHVPVTLNFKSGAAIQFNNKVNQVLKATPELNIIGIDRGERHLAYHTLVNSKGEILEQNSFNVVQNEHNGVKYETDYQASLVEKEKARDAARKSWDAIGKIKELKEGYLSQVVHKIARMMVDNNAIVALEDLNFGFKRGRMKVERQVYQKLEKMLIDKLNYLVFKDREAHDMGGVLNAYQLSGEFKSFKDMGKQTGFIFYVPAANTSKIDYATGFVNLLYPKYENLKQSAEFFNKMNRICYNADKNYFEFEVDYNNFRNNGTERLNKSQWTICTYGEERYQYQPSRREYLKVNVTEGIKSLLEKQGIAYRSGKDIKSYIIATNDTQFFKGLIFYLKLILQMRYTDGKDRDFILSPVADDKGVFFNSENAKDSEPKDADANGAYHIALKGLLLMQKIKNGDNKLAISNKEWYDFVQQKTYRI